MSDRTWEPGTLGMAYLCTISLERIAYHSPVLDLQRCAECDRVEAKEFVTKYIGFLVATSVEQSAASQDVRTHMAAMSRTRA